MTASSFQPDDLNMKGEGGCCTLQEWLWCETWCGNATKKYAKTIDLCNNPLTKEPKLEGARRIVKEWPGLDEEVATFTAQVW